MELSYFQAIIMGILQGLTEFLPVSSSGHLVMAQHLWGLEPESSQMLMFDLATHLGTMAAIIYYYRQAAMKYFGHLNQSLPLLKSPINAYKQSFSLRFTAWAMAAMFATGCVYILGKKVIDQGFENPASVATCWLITATFLFLTDKRKSARRSIKQFGLICALVIGLSQGLAIMPGISRSGATICAAVLLGLHRKWAGQFSFFIAIPAILGATILESIEYIQMEHNNMPWGPTIAGAIISAIVGFFALSLLLWALKKAKLKIFAWYCIIIAIATFVALAAGRFDHQAQPSTDAAMVYEKCDCLKVSN